jgi:hypothetical protein
MIVEEDGSMAGRWCWWQYVPPTQTIFDHWDGGSHLGHSGCAQPRSRGTSWHGANAWCNDNGKPRWCVTVGRTNLCVGEDLLVVEDGENDDARCRTTLGGTNGSWRWTSLRGWSSGRHRWDTTSEDGNRWIGKAPCERNKKIRWLAHDVCSVMEQGEPPVGCRLSEGEWVDREALSGRTKKLGAVARDDTWRRHSSHAATGEMTAKIRHKTWNQPFVLKSYVACCGAKEFN